MATAILMGVTSGAIHAATGPDHWLSLGPLVFGRRARAFRIGLQWGVGHAIGTLMMALPLWWLVAVSQLNVLSAMGERLSGFALMVTGLWPMLRKPKPSEPVASAAAPTGVGFFHGITGASALLIVVPMLGAGSQALQWYYLVAFAAGSAAAMALLTAALGLFASNKPSSVVHESVPRVFRVVSVAVGASWLLFP